MNSNDLFSFLDDGQQDNEHNFKHDSMVVGVSKSIEEPLKKRKATSGRPPSPSARNGDYNWQDPSDTSGPSAPKKLRFASPNPVVVDEFETEAKREVAASAGLTGGIEPGARLELKHQVCGSLISTDLVTCFACRFDTKLQYHQATIMSQSPIMFLQRNLIENSNSLWTLFKRFPSMLYSVTKAFWYPPIPVLEKLSSQNTQSRSA
jgi:hypothetical protein